MIKLDERFKIIFSSITGSHLYGTALPDSDTDTRGVFIPTEEFYLGFLNKVEQVESHEPDLTYWEISKFFKLCLDNNPNILELLFIPPDYWISYSNEWCQIRDHIPIFLSTKAKYTFSGYAVSQLHRIRKHRAWLLDPPKKNPEREDFGLPKTNTVTRDQINAFSELTSKGTPMELSTNALEVLQKEKAYINALRYWSQYQEWKRGRNPRRAELEARFGYDTKHASHLIRLLREGQELLATGFITFPRPDAEELLSIRRGAYTYQELIDKIGGDSNEQIDTLLSVKESVLPNRPNRNKADELCRNLIKKRILTSD